MIRYDINWTWQEISLFYVQTWTFICIIIHSGRSLAWIIMKERVKSKTAADLQLDMYTVQDGVICNLFHKMQK